MKVGLVAQYDNVRAANLAERLALELRGSGVDVVVDEMTAKSVTIDGVPPSSMDDADLVVSIGGDGTFLYTAREVGAVPIVGVNLGEVGFLNAVSPSEASSSIERLVEQFRELGSIPCREVARLVASGDDWELPPAMNEVVVQGEQRGHGGGCSIEIRVDGSLYSGGHADGVLVATPSGSTAYNLSERGPLVHPDVNAMVITEMCARDEMPPLLVDCAVEITVTVDDATTAYVVADGRDRVAIEPPDRVRIQRAVEPVRIAGPTVDFFEALGKLE